ncbi:hypothetical protein F511_27568 [Dorcoceras hygrometricum]|uniref:Uncharacterized protein n=1 Tax=Dorcoceras hygrometricum TaxID=472368 RepID=A0A2Z7AWE8_9LAMI|nr:hypothetical protein F511_27568 [Dorcoceras hygrometricum]
MRNSCDYRNSGTSVKNRYLASGMMSLAGNRFHHGTSVAASRTTSRIPASPIQSEQHPDLTSIADYLESCPDATNHQKEENHNRYSTYHHVWCYPLDITHLASEIENRRLYKATVELISAVPSLFLNPVVVMDQEAGSSFHHWWSSRYTALVSTFSYPPGSNGNSPDMVKSKRRKVLSTPYRPKQAPIVSRPALRPCARRYSTRSPLVSRFSNTTANPVDLISSSPASGDGDAVSNETSGDRVFDGDDDSGIPSESPAVDEVTMQYLNRAMQEKGYQESSVDKSTMTQLCRSHQSSSSCDLQVRRLSRPSQGSVVFRNTTNLNLANSRARIPKSYLLPAIGLKSEFILESDPDEKSRQNSSKSQSKSA